jgi:hypothetical protein
VRCLQHLEAGEVLPFHGTLRALVDALDLQEEYRARLETAARRWTA